MRELINSKIEWIGETPFNWKIGKILQFFHEGNEKNIGTKNQNLLSLSYGRIIRKDINTSGGLLPASFSTYNIVDKGDIIIRPTDLQNDKVSLRTGLVTEKGIITSAYIDMKPNEGVNSSFFHKLLHSYDICKVFYNMGSGVRQGIGFVDVSKLIVFVPPLEEQKKIADFLDDKCAQIDEITKDLEEKISKLEKYKSQVIYESVTKGLNNNVEYVDSGVSWINAIPQKWTIRRIRSLLACHESGDWGLNEEEGQTKKICIRIADFNYSSMEIDTSNLTIRGYNRINTKKILKEGDILLEKSGGGDKTPVGRNVYIDSSIASMDCIFTNFIELLRPCNDINSKYLSFAMKAIYSSFDMHFFFNQTTGLQNIDLYEYLKTFIPYPPLEEQKKIADFLDDKCAQIDEITKATREEIETLKQYKQSLIYEYVTGKKEVPNE